MHAVMQAKNCTWLMCLLYIGTPRTDQLHNTRQNRTDCVVSLVVRMICVYVSVLVSREHLPVSGPQ